MSDEQLTFAPPPRPVGRIPYRGQAPFTKGSETSEDAAQKIEIHKGSLQWTLLQYLRRIGLYGATDEQGAEALGIPGNTYRPRRRELEELGLVRRTDEKRPTASGRSAFVYRAVR